MRRRLRWAVAAGCLVLAGIAGANGGLERQAGAQAQEPPRGGATKAERARALRLLARMHHAAQSEIQLADLAEVRGARPETRRYGAELSAAFRAFDARLLASAARRGISEPRLAETLSGEDVTVMRKGAEDLSRLAEASGTDFDQTFWTALAHQQSAAGDLLAAAVNGVTDPELLDLVAEMSALLDRASRKALSALKPVSGPPRRPPGGGPVEAPATSQPAASSPPAPRPGP